MEQFDRQQGLSEQEKKYIAETDIDTLYSNIKKEHLYREVMRNVHFANNKKYLDTCIKTAGLNKNLIEDTIKAEVNDITKNDPKLARNQYQEALQAPWRRKNSTVALLQALAVKCVENIKYKDKYENIGDLLHNVYFKAKKPIDGYMGPNTMLVFSKIATTELNTKPKGQSDVIAFNGMVTPELIMKMYRVCNPLDENKVSFSEDKRKEQEETKPEQKVTESKPKPEHPVIHESTPPDVPNPEISTSDQIHTTAAEIIALQKETQAHPDQKQAIDEKIKTKQEQGRTQVQEANTEILNQNTSKLAEDVGQIQKLRTLNHAIHPEWAKRLFDESAKQEEGKIIYGVYNEAHDKVLDIWMYTTGEYQGRFYIGKGDKVLQIAEPRQRLDTGSIALHLDQIIKKLQE